MHTQNSSSTIPHKTKLSPHPISQCAHVTHRMAGADLILSGDWTTASMMCCRTMTLSGSAITYTTSLGSLVNRAFQYLVTVFLKYIAPVQYTQTCNTCSCTDYRIYM